MAETQREPSIYLFSLSLDGCIFLIFIIRSLNGICIRINSYFSFTYHRGFEYLHATNVIIVIISIRLEGPFAVSLFHTVKMFKHWILLPVEVQHFFFAGPHCVSE